MKISRQRAPECVIQVERLAKFFAEVEALIDLSFEVYEGEVFGFLGPNGAGKTTTLAILEGLLQADRGRAMLLGMDVQRSAPAIKRRIGVQLQTTSLLPDLTIYEQVQLFAHLYGHQPMCGEILDLLERVGLAEKGDALPENLSGAQQQRLSLALALVNHPEIVFLDEPTTGLDPQSRRALWQIIRELRSQGKTIVLITEKEQPLAPLVERAAARGRLDKPSRSHCRG